MCHLRPQTSVFALAFPLAGVNADERLVLASPSSFTPGQLLQVFSRSGTRYRYVLAIAAVGENAPIRKLAWLTSILWMMSNRGPSTWMTYLPSGPLVTVVVWAPAFVLAGGEDIRKVAFPLIWIGWSRNQKIDQLKKKCLFIVDPSGCSKTYHSIILYRIQGEWVIAYVTWIAAMS